MHSRTSSRAPKARDFLDPNAPDQLDPVPHQPGKGADAVSAVYHLSLKGRGFYHINNSHMLKQWFFVHSNNKDLRIDCWDGLSGELFLSGWDGESTAVPEHVLDRMVARLAPPPPPPAVGAGEGEGGREVAEVQAAEVKAEVRRDEGSDSDGTVEYMKTIAGKKESGGGRRVSEEGEGGERKKARVEEKVEEEEEEEDFGPLVQPGGRAPGSVAAAVAPGGPEGRGGAELGGEAEGRQQAVDAAAAVEAGGGGKKGRGELSGAAAAAAAAAGGGGQKGGEQSSAFAKFVSDVESECLLLLTYDLDRPRTANAAAVTASLEENGDGREAAVSHLRKLFDRNVPAKSALKVLLKLCEAKTTVKLGR